jgi:hypothetical protein
MPFLKKNAKYMAFSKKKQSTWPCTTDKLAGRCFDPSCRQLINWLGRRLLVKVPDADELEVEVWWSSGLNPLPKKQRRSTASILMYTAWNIWKERN